MTGGSSTPLFERVCLIGVGLEGGSLALNMKQRGLARHVTGVARRPETLARIRELGLVDEATDDVRAAVRDADLVIFCTPVGAYAERADKLQGAFKADAIVSDVGSVKQATIRDLGPAIPDSVHFACVFWTRIPTSPTVPIGAAMLS